MWNSTDEHLELAKKEQGKEQQDSCHAKEESKKDNNN